MKRLIIDKVMMLLLVLALGIIVYVHNLVDKSTQQLKNEEIKRTEAYAEHIAHILLRKTKGKLYENLSRDIGLRTALQDSLEAMLTSRYKYIFVIKQLKPHYYRFLLDGSTTSKEKFGSIFVPISRVYDEVYASRKPSIIKQQDSMNDIWLSLLYPIVWHNRIEGMLVLDLSKQYGNQLTNFNFPATKLLNTVQWIFGLAVIILLIIVWHTMRLRRRLYVDAVSGSYSKTYLFDFAATHTLEDYHAVLLDIDELKFINKIYGYEIGDKLLKEFVRFCRWSLPKNSEIVRLGGSEFFLFIPNNVELTSFVEKFYQTLRYEIFEIDMYEINLKLSMCAVSIPPNTTSLPYIQHVLYETMMEIKKRGKNHYKIIALKDVFDLHHRQIDYINDLLSEDNIHILFQPIYDYRSKEIVKYECLARLYDAKADTYIIPDKFIEVIRGTSVYIKMSRYVFEKVFSTLEQDPDVYLSVNVGLDDLFNHEMIGMIDRFLQRFHNVTSRLTFEVVENSPIDSYDQVNAAFKVITRSGAKIAIDDFGSGYADFQHLAYLKADIVKVDGQLIRRLASEKDERIKTIIQTIVTVAHRFDMEVVAEYVSDDTIHRIIASLGFDYGQGYYFGKPDTCYKKIGKGLK